MLNPTAKEELLEEWKKYSPFIQGEETVIWDGLNWLHRYPLLPEEKELEKGYKWQYVINPLLVLPLITSIKITEFIIKGWIFGCSPEVEYWAEKIDTMLLASSVEELIYKIQLCQNYD